MGLSVKSINEICITDLPYAYSRQAIPARREQIPKISSALKWPHLHKIAERLVQYDHDVEIGLLISVNCIRAVKPLEIIPGSKNEPCGQRTALGWRIIVNVNPCEGENVNDALVHKAIVQEVEIVLKGPVIFSLCQPKSKKSMNHITSGKCLK